MKITFETDSLEEASNIISILSGGAPTTAKPAAKKVAAKKAAKAKDPEPEVQEAEVVESTRTEEEVTVKAKELVAASSPAVLRSVLDTIIGEGVKIGGAPKDKYDAIFDAVEAKLAEINDV